MIKKIRANKIWALLLLCCLFTTNKVRASQPSVHTYERLVRPALYAAATWSSSVGFVALAYTKIDSLSNNKTEANKQKNCIYGIASTVWVSLIFIGFFSGLNARIQSWLENQFRQRGKSKDWATCIIIVWSFFLPFMCDALIGLLYKKK